MVSLTALFVSDTLQREVAAWLANKETGSLQKEAAAISRHFLQEGLRKPRKHLDQQSRIPSRGLKI
jgi:hypothetical protein